jgi:Ca-activated chloride channel family protein
MPLELRSQNVKVDIKEQVATTNIRQVFFNPSHQRLEGTFIFPIPRGAQIDKFSMEVNGKMQEAELLDAKKARKIYEDIVRRAKDPALFEYAQQGLFKVRIFPIEPRKEKEVKIKYTEVLPKDGNMVRYLYHLNLAKYSTRPIKDLSVKVEIESEAGEIKSVYSPSHEVEVKRHGKQRVVIGLEEENLKPDADLQLYYSLRGKDGGDVDVAAITHKEDADESGYFMLLVSPGAWADDKPAMPKDIVFVFDSSGSMRGKKIEQAKKAMEFCVGSLNPGDRFEIVRFSTEAEPVFGKLTKADAKAKKRATKFLGSVRAIGGTAIEEALETASEILAKKASKNRPAQIIFLTDGQPTIGAIKEDVIINGLEKELEETKAKIRVFCFGIGTNVNVHLLDKITEKTNAVSQYVLPEENIETKVSRFYSKISEPVLTGLEVKIDGPDRINKLYPKELPDLFKGDQVVVTGRYESGKKDATITLTGSMTGKERNFRYKANFPKTNDDNEFIPRLWATRRVGYLLEEIRLRGEKKELKEEVARLARKYNIVTPYTSYLILEDEARDGIALTRRSHFGGLRDDRGVAFDSAAPAPAAWEALDSLIVIEKEEYRKFSKDKSGEGAVRGAASGAELKNAKGLADLGRAVDSSYSSSDRGRANETIQSLIIGGKTFHRAGDLWIDDDARDDKDKKIEELEFGSKEYFDFLAANPKLCRWLSVGNKVDLLDKGKIYRVR